LVWRKAKVVHHLSLKKIATITARNANQRSSFAASSPHSMMVMV